jgi:predicted double-glycine peptidase
MKVTCPISGCGESYHVSVNPATGKLRDPSQAKEFIAHLKTHTKEELVRQILDMSVGLKTLYNVLNSCSK